MGYLFSDVCTSTSIGTGTTTTLLNGGTNFTASSLAGTFVCVSPVYAETGAVTAAQSIFPYFTTQSQSIGSIQPKEILLAPTSGGLGTSINSMYPIARTFEFNTRIPNSNTPLSFYGTALVANTVAPRMGGTIWFDTDQPMSGSYESFWACNTAVQLGSTAAATTNLPNITVNGATSLEKIYAHVAPLVVTQSESYIGYLSVNSSDLAPQQTLRAYVQPMAVGLAATTTPMQPDALYHPEKMTLRNTATLAGSYVQEEAQTAAPNVNWGLKFLRGAYA